MNKVCFNLTAVLHRGQRKFIVNYRIQWNPIITVTNGPKKIGRNNEVTVLKRVSLHENLWTFLLGGQKKCS